MYNIYIYSAAFSQRWGTIGTHTFAQHESLAHVVCTRTFNERQTLHMAPGFDYSQGIAGACFSPDSKKIFVGTFHVHVSDRPATH